MIKTDIGSFGKRDFGELHDRTKELLGKNRYGEFPGEEDTTVGLSLDKRGRAIGITLRNDICEETQDFYPYYPFQRLTFMNPRTGNMLFREQDGWQGRDESGTFSDVVWGGVTTEQNPAINHHIDIAPYIHRVNNPEISSEHILDQYGRTPEGQDRGKRVMQLFNDLTNRSMSQAINDETAVEKPVEGAPTGELQVRGIRPVSIYDLSLPIAFRGELAIRRINYADSSREHNVYLIPGSDELGYVRYAPRPTDGRLVCTIINDFGKRLRRYPAEADEGEAMIDVLKNAIKIA